MKRLALAFPVLSVALFFGCGSSHKSAGSDPFVGTWTCNTSQTYNFTTPSGTPPQTAPSMTIYTVTDNGSGTITLTLTSDAGNVCSVKETRSGDTATLEPGQMCLIDGVTVSYTGGTATLNGNAYTSSYQFTFTGTLMVTINADAGPPLMVMVAGTGTGTDSCNKHDGGS